MTSGLPGLAALERLRGVPLSSRHASKTNLDGRLPRAGVASERLGAGGIPNGFATATSAFSQSVHCGR